MRTSVRALISLVGIAIGMATQSAAAIEPLGQKWCSGFKVRFFAGGGPGDAYGSIVQAGGEQAAQDLGADIEVIFSGWNSEKMLQQMREAIAQQVDGIAVMGFPGEAAMFPVAEEAASAGILAQYMTVDVPEVRAEFGGGYVGVSDLLAQGRGLGNEALKQFGLKSGDAVAVFAAQDSKERAAREIGTIKAFEEAGLTVLNLPGLSKYASDPNLAIPIITATLAQHPDIKLIAYPGGQMLSNAETYMTAAGKEPGDVINIGFDSSPQIIDGFSHNWVQLTSDQQPYQQGYLSVLSLCQRKFLGLTPINFETGSGFIDRSNFESVGALAARGLR